MEIPISNGLPQTPDPYTVAFKTFSFNIGRFTLSPNYLQAGLIIFMIFLILLSLSRMRHLYVHWNLQSFLPNVAFGVFITLMIEGFLIMNGHTVLTEILGWKNAPKPISTALDEGRGQLINVLGIEDHATESASFVIETYDKLTIEEKALVREHISRDK